MMNNKTRKVMENMVANYGNKEFTFDRWEAMFNTSCYYSINAGITFNTFRKYANLEKIIRTEAVTVQELVDKLNQYGECQYDEDDYDYNVKYIVKDNQPFKEITLYRFNGIKG
jgi:hypothetical protein